MIDYVDEKKLEHIINKNNKLILVFIKGISCGVCHAVENRINSSYPEKFKDLDIYYATLEESPLFRGNHLVFTIPTLILFDANKEIHRESRIIDFQRLERILKLYYEN